MPSSNRVVVITGGGTGIGHAIARAFFDTGARVVLNGRRTVVLEKAARELDPSGERVAVLPGDIGAPGTAEQLVATAVERFGRLDVLVNNAGVFAPIPFLEHRDEDLDTYLRVILKGTFFACRAAIPEMRRHGGGSVVNVGSMWADLALAATPSSAYSAAKAGVHALTRNLAMEFAKDRIRVNAVAPAVVETPVYETFLTPDQARSVLQSFRPFHPLGRNGQPEDVVGAILFLSSDAASWITGVVMPVDGGATAGRP